MTTASKKLFLLLALLLIPCFSAFAGSDPNVRSFTFRVQDNGEIVVQDGYQEIARVFPWIFTGKWKHHRWGGSFKFKSSDGLESEKGSNTLMVNQVPVDLEYSVECLGRGLRIHYQLEPRETLAVSAVEVYCRFPYGDWQGSTFAFEDLKGFIPIDAWNEKNPESAWLIQQADNIPLQIGPSTYHSHLTVHLNPENLYLLLADDRFQDPKLSIVLNHNDTPGYGANPQPNWNWSKGQAKVFDFTLTFNRDMDCSSKPSPLPTLGVSQSPPETPTPDFSQFLSTLRAPSPAPTIIINSSPTSFAAPVSPSSFSNLDLPPMPNKQKPLKILPTLTSTPNLSLLTSNFPSPQIPSPTPLIPLPPSINPVPKTSLSPSPPIDRKQPAPFPPTSTPTPNFLPSSTPLPLWYSLLDQDHTVKFSDPPANIYVVLGDGPGRYRADVLNSSGKRMETLLDRVITIETDAWLAWDCLDGDGNPVAPGRYFVIIYKDGKPLKSLEVIRDAKRR